MNNYPGPRRFSKYRNEVPLQDYLEQLDKHLEKLFEQKLLNLSARLDELKESIAEARRIMEARMDGFPGLFVRKGDADVAITELKAKVELISIMISKTEEDRPIPRIEYSLQHRALEDKVSQNMKDYAISIEILRKDTETKFEKIDEKTQELQNLRANINGRLWALGVGGAIAIVVTQFMIHYVFKIHP